MCVGSRGMWGGGGVELLNLEDMDRQRQRWETDREGSMNEKG